MLDKAAIVKLKMPPASAKKDPMLEMDDADFQDMPEEGSDEEEASEPVAEAAQEAKDLQKVPDEELLAEFKRRGLKADQLDSADESMDETDAAAEEGY